uniref:Lipopolysaccharide-induced tumor necrosis factor-alpha factor 3 n=1 Tax=Brachionus koreanus TaxID=1199090 RepID=A0A0N9K0R0_9BILA|nr:lipopolysaccharide-induced tumor necrosis factor-alpha factor 3 [Brachionus koreanus]
MYDNQRGSELPPPYTEDRYADRSAPNEQKSQERFSQPSAPEIATECLIYEPQQPNIVYACVPMRLGDNSTQLMCPNCRANVLTVVKRESGLLTWLLGASICFLGFGCGCCLIPFCINSCKDSEHYCPNCKFMIGKNKKL